MEREGIITTTVVVINEIMNKIKIIPTYRNKVILNNTLGYLHYYG